MSKLTSRLKAHRFAKLTFAVALLGVLAGVALDWSGKASSRFRTKVPQAIQPIVTTKTSAVQVLGSERTLLGTSPILVVRLQNVSGRDIKAYTIASGKTWMTRNYFLGEESFAPGEIENQFVPLSSDTSQDLRVKFASGSELTIAAVLFADGKGDGAPIHVSRLAEKYAGIRDQATRILPCLRGLSLLSGAKHELALAACEDEAVRLPLKMHGRSSDYESGLQDVQQGVLNQLNEIKEKIRVNQPNEAAAKQERLKRVLQRLAESSQ